MPPSPLPEFGPRVSEAQGHVSAFSQQKFYIQYTQYTQFIKEHHPVYTVLYPRDPHGSSAGSSWIIRDPHGSSASFTSDSENPPPHLQQGHHHFAVPLLRCPMQRCHTLQVGDIHLRPLRQQGVHHGQVSVAARQVQGRDAGQVLEGTNASG